MSHGNLEKCEPNLIPMLDMILQLIMFFMLVANFVADDFNNAVILPHANQARALHKSEDYVIILNVDKEGRVLLMKIDPDSKRMEDLANNYKSQIRAQKGTPEYEKAERAALERAHEVAFEEKIKSLVDAKKGIHPDILDSSDRIEAYMSDKLRFDRDRMTKQKKEKPDVEPKTSLVVLRAHKNTTYGRVNSVMLACRSARIPDDKKLAGNEFNDIEYKEVQLRAVIGPKN